MTEEELRKMAEHAAPAIAEILKNPGKGELDHLVPHREFGKIELKEGTAADVEFEIEFATNPVFEGVILGPYSKDKKVWFSNMARRGFTVGIRHDDHDEWLEGTVNYWVNGYRYLPTEK